jgi:hypothetical protein
MLTNVASALHVHAAIESELESLTVVVKSLVSQHFLLTNYSALLLYPLIFNLFNTS